MGGGFQNGEAYSSMPVGTKLQGHIDSIKGSFGFIRSFHAPPCLSIYSLALHIHLRQDHAGPVPGALLRAAVTASMFAQYLMCESPLGMSHSSTCVSMKCRVPTAADAIFFHSSELLTEGAPQSNGESSALEQVQGSVSSAAPQPQEQPLSHVRSTESAPCCSL